ncbi:hypothetical protein DUNSADRAFT_2536 [Dunaliella salina]|uniref:Encoded protein n=1 Tax=Dunaliella salina TaxID=3046 RepID=A0ABQ7FWC1_DUNSA|nr:hypothetical protein DUNSADRAFT_2536 [Dunaliella salina]|eukprot:KAF5826616.1 hypothetical protein DUNSADRAFT_2536 [Dunaliella salina]
MTILVIGMLTVLVLGTTDHPEFDQTFGMCPTMQEHFNPNMFPSLTRHPSNRRYILSGADAFREDRGTHGNLPKSANHPKHYQLELIPE